MNILLTQDELKVLVGLLSQVQLVAKDSRIVNPLIDKLDSFIEKPKPQDIPKKTIEGEVII